MYPTPQCCLVFEGSPTDSFDPPPSLQAFLPSVNSDMDALLGFFVCLYFLTCLLSVVLELFITKAFTSAVLAHP